MSAFAIQCRCSQGTPLKLQGPPVDLTLLQCYTSVTAQAVMFMRLGCGLCDKPILSCMYSQKFGYIIGHSLACQQNECLCNLQAEEAEQNQEWAKAEKLYAEATFIDTAASLINTALWLGLCRTRWHLQLSDSSVEACDNTLSLQPDNTEAIKYKVAPLPQPLLLSIMHQSRKPTRRLTAS